MNTAALLLHLRAGGVRLGIQDSRLSYRAPREAATPSLHRLIVDHQSTLLELLEGRVEPRPSVLNLANEYRRVRGDGFREEFIEVTGCDFWEVTPAWIDLYTFAAWLSALDFENPTPSSLLKGSRS
jgi:hypothetical protein